MRIISLAEAKSKGLVEVLDQAPLFTRSGDLVAIASGEIKKVADTFYSREDTWDDEPECRIHMVLLEDGTYIPEECCREVVAHMDRLGADSVEVEMTIDSTEWVTECGWVTRRDTGKPVGDILLARESLAAKGDPDPSVHFYTRVVLQEGCARSGLFMSAHSYKTRPHITSWADGLYFA